MKHKATGTRGSWFAEVGGELLPCVHAFWYKAPQYDDPHAVSGERKWEELVAAIRDKGRVILTNDDAIDGGFGFNRSSYIAEFSISDLEFEHGHLKFRMVKRLRDLE